MRFYDQDDKKPEAAFDEHRQGNFSVEEEMSPTNRRGSALNSTFSRGKPDPETELLRDYFRRVGKAKMGT